MNTLFCLGFAPFSCSPNPPRLFSKSYMHIDQNISKQTIIVNKQYYSIIIQAMKQYNHDSHDILHNKN
jgi:hypothetical protein